MKGALAAVLTGLQNLDHDEARERPVDRLTAMALIQCQTGARAMDEAKLASLGVDLVAYKFSHRADSRTAAENLLTEILGWKRHCKGMSEDKRRRIARWALMEFLIDFCPTCKGAKEVPGTEEVEGARPMMICQSCSGSGRRRYSDEERTEALGEPAAQAMYHAHSIMGHASSLATRRAAEILERWR